VNVVTLSGNLATEVELREVGEGKQKASFLLAVDRPVKDEADFVWVTVWDRQAETCHQFLTKGRRIALDGRLRSRSWEEDGKKRNAIEVVANRVQFLTPNPESDPRSAEIPFEAAVV
jgi:single-strand DNA-binding protein